MPYSTPRRVAGSLIICLLASFICFHATAAVAPARAERPADSLAPMSDDTEACLACHTTVIPGVHGDWQRSRHAWVTVGEAMDRPELERRVSAASVPQDYLETGVGCAECHMMNPGDHPDTFDHNGYAIHTVVTPEDCAVCHPEERKQYTQNIMSFAHINLDENPLYQLLQTAVNGVQHVDGLEVSTDEPTPLTSSDACYHCHGTRVTLDSLAARETSLGEMDLPVYSGWPNQGVGRINPDGSQ
ncbi:MAG: hydroxylamine oxidase, partial [Candidatus Eisenbacteria bacterium]|nr:hydroxylamine oxidase [Candidatus Eisenbacteria bacterium]